MVPSGIQNIRAEEEIRHLSKISDELYDNARSDEELKAARDAVSKSTPHACCWICCVWSYVDAIKKNNLICKNFSNQEDSIIDRFNTQGKEKGYFVEWNIETQPKPKRVGLNVKLNLTRRRQFCADNGIEFVSPFGPQFGGVTAPMTNPDPFPIVTEQPPSYVQ